MSTQSLSQNEMENLAQHYRNQTVIKGIVQTVTFMNLPVQVNGEVKTVETEAAVFRLEGGVKAYCPAQEFREHNFRSLNGFIGHVQNLIIDRLDLDNSIAMVSVRKADAIESQNFWDQIKYLERKEALDEEIFTGVVQGVNESNKRIHVRVKGTDCYMMPNDWNWERNVDLRAEVDRGMDVQVKVTRFDEENKIVRVSRKATVQDPFELLENMRENDLTVGNVVAVSPIHGIFVRVEEGVTLKATKPRKLEEPLPGDTVSCRIRELNAKERKGKVVIVDYPRGKKKMKDLTSFLYE